MDKEQKLKELLESAKKCSNKGRWYVYEQYKSQLGLLDLTNTEYEQACRKLTQYLRV